MLALTDLNDLRATFFCERYARRVSKIWHEVEKLNSSTLSLHSVDGLLQGHRRDAVVVCEDVLDVSLVVPKDSDSANIRRTLGENHVTLVEEQAGHQI